MVAGFLDAGILKVFPADQSPAVWNSGASRHRVSIQPPAFWKLWSIAAVALVAGFRSNPCRLAIVRVVSLPRHTPKKPPDMAVHAEKQNWNEKEIDINASSVLSRRLNVPPERRSRLIALGRAKGILMDCGMVVSASVLCGQWLPTNEKRMSR